MPGLVKVGYSTKDPSLRAEELNHTGSPHPYVVEYEILTWDPRDIEQSVHSRLKEKREGKEWFRCTIEEAIVAIKDEVGKDSLLENYIKANRESAEALRKQKIREEEARKKAEEEAKRQRLALDEAKRRAAAEEQNRQIQELEKKRENTSSIVKSALFFVGLVVIAIWIGGFLGGFRKEEPTSISVDPRAQNMAPQSPSLPYNSSYQTNATKKMSSKTSRGINSLRSIDFKNFTYIINGHHDKFVNGHRVERDGSVRQDTYILSVDFVDFDLDSSEEAIVNIQVNRIGYFYIIGLENGRPTILYYEDCSLGGCGITIDKNSIHITKAHFLQSDYLCCPSYQEMYEIKANGKQYFQHNKQLVALNR